MLTKRIRVMALLLLTVLMATSVSHAAPMTSNPITMPRAVSTGAYGSNEVMTGKSPTTGLDWSGSYPDDYRPILVQISNSPEARPHLNLSEADVVYESILWAPGYTRYTALFSDNHPDIVGATRSIRLHHCEIRQEWDCPFVFWGAQTTSGTSVLDYFRANNVSADFLFDGTGIKGTKSGSYFFRSTDRVSPHNAMVKLSEIATTQWPNGENGSAYKPKAHAYRFSNSPTRGGDTAVSIDINYASDYHPSYTFNAEKRVYERSYNGEAQYDGTTGKRIEASNVIVQFCETSYFQQAASRPVISMVKGGAMFAFIDGRVISGTWERRSANDRTVFLAGGEEITMLPGKTFIQVVPMSFEFTYTRENGEQQVMNSGTEVVGNTETFDEKDTAADLDKTE